VIYPRLALHDLDAFAVDANSYAALGISQLDAVPERDPVEYTERLAEIAPELANLWWPEDRAYER
jgi:hypothetical protein